MINLIKSPFFREKETKVALADFVRTADRLSMDRECIRFEEGFAEKQGRRHAVFVNSGSSANLILLQALLNIGRLKKGDRVGFSALTWATNVMPIIELGLEPVPIDCELDTLNVSPTTLQDHIKDLDALFLTNVLGFADEIDELRELCGQHDILLLEDNCEGLGSKVKGVHLGNFGLASTFSFFIGHHLSTIEGGMVCTDDDKVWRMLLMVRAHGWDRNLQRRDQDGLRKEFGVTPFFGKYTFYDLGYNVRPTEINGFLGNSQLSYWDEIVRRRADNFEYFHNIINSHPDILPLRLDHMNPISNFAVPVVFTSKDKFDLYKKKFEDGNVEIRPIIAGNITEQPFFEKYQPVNYRLTNASFVHENGFYFGNNPDMTEEDIKTLGGLLENHGK